MTDPHIEIKEGAMQNQPARPTNAQKIEQAARDAAAAASAAIEHPHETAREISDRFVAAAGAAPGQAQGALFNFANRYGKESAADIIVPTFNKGVQATRERVNAGRQGGFDAAPSFTSTKGKQQKMNLFTTYQGVAGADPHAHGSRPVNFGMHQHPVNFGAGTAIPHGASRGSAVPTSGSAVNFNNLHGFGGAAHTGSLFGGKTFGMNDGILKASGTGKLNFTQSVMAKNQKAASKKKSKK